MSCQTSFVRPGTYPRAPPALPLCITRPDMFTDDEPFYDFHISGPPTKGNNLRAFADVSGEMRSRIPYGPRETMSTDDWAIVHVSADFS